MIAINSSTRVRGLSLIRLPVFAEFVIELHPSDESGLFCKLTYLCKKFNAPTSGVI